VHGAMAVTDFVYQGPKRGADRAVVLAHGAGADMNAAALTTVADALADVKIPSLRFNFPYMAAGRRSPDRPPVLEGAVRDAAALLAKQSKVAPERLVLGGRSMGGRVCSMVVADGLPSAGLVLLGYPLHPPGNAENLRIEHLPRITVPCLFVSGTRDSFGTPDELKRHAKKIKGKVTWHWIDTGDHSFRPLKASGLTPASALEGAAGAVVSFVTAL
ncbi:MAG TPA: alpha/beta family hydrolase, partial [Acidimicrobiia bacterium]|nr:alpha/beta family hydrolase [Acidimicrobiia bacterium]